MEIKSELDIANREDLKSLWERFRKSYKSLTDEERKNVAVNVQKKIKNDLAQLQTMKASTSFAQQNIDFTSSVEKLVGVGNSSQPGILNEALTHLADWDKKPTVLDTQPQKFIKRDHDITVLKTALLYANLALTPAGVVSQKIGGVIEGADAQLIYPAKVAMPSQRAIASNSSCKAFKDALGKTCLYCSDGSFNGCLMVPDAGYVYGAKMPKGECRGTDCSAFVSSCIDSKIRHTTLSLQNIAQELTKAKSASERNNAKSEKFIAGSDFTVLDPKKSQLEEGDIVVWRGKGIAHVVFFLKWKDEAKKEFIAIEAARQSSKEGVVIDQYQLFHRGITPSVLRPKEREI